MMKPMTSEKGMTLVELLIALVIFAIGLLAIAGMQVTAIRANMYSNVGSGSVAAAQGKLEEILSLAATSSAFKPPAQPESIETVTLPDGAIYTLTYEVTPDSPVSGVATIVVKAQLQGGPIRTTLTGYKRVE